MASRREDVETEVRSYCAAQVHEITLQKKLFKSF